MPKLSLTVLFAASLALVAHATPADESSQLEEIYSNFADSADALYICCAANSISPRGQPHPQIVAMSFVPAQDRSVRKIVLAIQHIDGANNLKVSLRADDGGTPGPVLKKFEASNLPEFGSCCETVSLPTKAIPVTAGNRYWVVVRAVGDTRGAWNQNARLVAGLTATNHGLGWETHSEREMAFKILGE